MTSLKALENSLYWQNVVLRQSKDPAQIARCKAAIERLQAQIKEQIEQQTELAVFGVTFTKDGEKVSIEQGLDALKAQP